MLAYASEHDSATYCPPEWVREVHTVKRSTTRTPRRFALRSALLAPVLAGLLLPACISRVTPGPANALRDPDAPAPPPEDQQHPQTNNPGTEPLPSEWATSTVREDEAAEPRATLSPMPVAAGARPWMGIEMRQTEDRGVVVEGVFPGSPAASSGLQPGDVLVALGSQAIVRPPDVHAVLDAHAVGESLVLRVRRDGRERLLRLQLVAKPESNQLMRTLYVGKPAPSISALRTVQGAVVPSLEQLRGHVVVVEFWATWCVACRLLTPTLNRWHEELGAHGVRVLAVTTEPYEEVAQSLTQLDMRMPVFVDEPGEVTVAYRAAALPTLFLIDRQGLVNDVLVGYHPEEVERFRSRLGELAKSPTARPLP